LNVFAPRNGAEFRRVLRPDGVLLVVTPGPDHLAELGTAAGQLSVDPEKDRRLAAALPGFALRERQVLRVPLRLSPLDVWRVVHMGPAGHHRTDPAPEPGGEPTEATASFVISAYRPEQPFTGRRGQAGVRP
jgi:23S rRNA (guanine745-N1)-methyltransferase